MTRWDEFSHIVDDVGLFMILSSHLIHLDRPVQTRRRQTSCDVHDDVEPIPADMIRREMGIGKLDEETDAEGYRKAPAEGTPWRTTQRHEEQVARRDAHRARDEMVNVCREKITGIRSEKLLVHPDDENRPQCNTYVHHRRFGHPTFPDAYDTATDHRAYEGYDAKGHPFGECEFNPNNPL